MRQSHRHNADWLAAWLESRLGQRGPSLLLALAMEALLVLAMLTLGRGDGKPKPRILAVSMSAKSFADEDKPAPEPKPAKAPAKRPTFTRATPQTQPQPQPVTPLPSPPAAPPIIPLSKREMAVLDITNLPRSPAAPAAPRRNYGPAAPVGEADTAEVGGSGPNGEKLYAASWYREPYDDELSGYLSTASGPGWALIACRTVPDYRVDSCVALDEYPNGSNLARAVLAAAWQFQVRPPRLGGRVKVGEWVRIRISYENRRR